MNFDDVNFLSQMRNDVREQQKLTATYNVANSIDKLNERINVENEKTLKEIQSNSKTQNKQYRNTLIVSILTFLVAVGSLCVSIFCR